MAVLMVRYDTGEWDVIETAGARTRSCPISLSELRFWDGGKDGKRGHTSFLEFGGYTLFGGCEGEDLSGCSTFLEAMDTWADARGVVSVDLNGLRVWPTGRKRYVTHERRPAPAGKAGPSDASGDAGDGHEGITTVTRTSKANRVRAVLAALAALATNALCVAMAVRVAMAGAAGGVGVWGICSLLAFAALVDWAIWADGILDRARGIRPPDDSWEGQEA